MRLLGVVYGRLFDLLGLITVVLLALLMFGISADVFARNARLGAVPATVELTEYALFVITFLGAPWVLRQNAHIRIDILVDTLPKPLARWLDWFTNIAGAVIAATLTYYALTVVLDSHAKGSRIIKELIFPEWWVFALVVFSGFLLCAEFIRRVCVAIRAPEAAAPPSAGTVSTPF